MVDVVEVSLNGQVRENYRINVRGINERPTEADVINEAKQNMREDGYSEEDISRATFKVHYGR